LPKSGNWVIAKSAEPGFKITQLPDFGNYQFLRLSAFIRGELPGESNRFFNGVQDAARLLTFLIPL